MKIIDLLLSPGVHISCELFPPKESTQLKDAKKVVKEMAALHPSFMSVTYGAGGSTAEHTEEIANEIQNVNGVTALAHVTCVSSSIDGIDNHLNALKKLGIENLLVLRGDIPRDRTFHNENTYAHASELMEKVSASNDFCIGGACYPEGHPESRSLDEDVDSLLRKIENGCRFLTTQMFFDNNVLYSFMFRALKHGVDVPIVAGIMPVTNGKQIRRICELSGTGLPPRFRSIVDRFGDSPDAMKQAGIAYATEQIIDLIANGVNNVHIYSMNRPDIAGKIFENLSEIFVRK